MSKPLHMARILCGIGIWVNAASNSSGQTVTFAEISPVVQSKCATCHHPGGPAPFALQTFADVQKRARQIVEVVERRYMPPWLPRASGYRFKNDRSLSDSEIDLIRRWYRDGANEGTPIQSDRNETRRSTWRLGTPDIVVSTPKPHALSANSSEVFWNYAISLAPHLDTHKHYVQAVEIKPGNPQAVHHIVGLVDHDGQSSLNETLVSIGVPGMDFSLGEIPTGQTLLWSPGRTAQWPADGFAWPVTKATHIVLQLHLFPTGKAEKIQPELGLYLTDQPPTKHALSLMLEADVIDIPAGAKNYIVRDKFELPVDVKLLTVYPHAHYLAKTVTVTATLPNAEPSTLLRIDDWDFNWQDEYTFTEPVDLPAGTLLQMEFSYDNSAENVRNPHHPPQRVVLGNNSTDEMGNVLFQMLVSSEQQRRELDVARWQKKLATTPLDPMANQNLGMIHESAGKLTLALKHYRRVLQTEPRSSLANENVAVVNSKMLNYSTADQFFRQALDLDPESTSVMNHWGMSFLRRGDLPKAARLLKRALKAMPDFLEAQLNLGETYLRLGDTPNAIKQFRAATKSSPRSALAHFNLGAVLMQAGQFEQAKSSLLTAVDCDEDFSSAHNNLGIVLFRLGETDEASKHFERAINIDPLNDSARQNLRVLQQTGPKP